jgi:photosystem II stability/assembly factor-like uncharacterized protein
LEKNMRSSFCGLAILGCLLLTASRAAADWQPVTAALIEKEKPGYGKLCGVAVDHKSGDVYVNLSDRGIYRSSDQGQTWQRQGTETLKGRTEWPGCMQFDPTGKSKRLVVALVYGAPIAVSPDAGIAWRYMNPKSSHVDWCAVDWSDPELGFVLALKHESGDLLIASNDGGKSFRDVGKGYGPAWIFDKNTAVVAQARSKTQPKPGLLRTTDGGQTFQSCGEYTTRALPKWREGKLYWVVEGALITSADQGQSWQKAGDLKDGRYGPIFGKDDRHMFVLTGAGIVESRDGGASWSKALALPKGVPGSGALTWMEYDPVHDVLYAMRMTSDLYKLERKALP